MKTIYITTTDYNLLLMLFAEFPPKFKEELNNAVILQPSAISPKIVTINSSVELRDLQSDEIEEWIVSMPEHANLSQNRISILAPIGTAILGYSEGDTIEWETPGGIRTLKIQKVRPQASSIPNPAIPLHSLA